MTIRRTPDLHDIVQELCETTQHREFYLRKKKPRYHATDNAPLLVQLARSAMPTYTRLDGTGKVAGSRPAANVDAIDTLLRIHTDTSIWLRTLNATTTGNTINLVRHLASLTRTTDHCGRTRPQREPQPPYPVTCCTAHRIETDLRRWWVWARVATGWDLPAWQPANTCPLCAARGTLRVRLIDQIASCAECHQTWDQTTIGLLADHIRTENHDHKAS